MSSGIPIRLVALFALLCLGIAPQAFPQSPKRPEPIMVNAGQNDDSKAQLDLLAQTAGNSKLIILIHRLGNGESQPVVGRRRLRTATWYLENVRAVEKQRLIIGKGERVN